jgi:hypothetical protein
MHRAAIYGLFDCDGVFSVSYFVILAAWENAACNEDQRSIQSQSLKKHLTDAICSEPW